MFTLVKSQKDNFLFTALARLIVFVLSFSLIFSPTAVHAQSILNLPIPGTMVSPSPAFVPVLLKGMTIHPDDPLRFDFIIDSGNTDFTEDKIKTESQRLVKYFLASMTVPKDDLWVNLSPYEDDRIIPDELGKTELGRDMLAQDYILKQLTASLMYPEEELGKKFWDRVYRMTEERFGTSEIPVNTFNKVWILPESATVYEYGQTVYVVDARLKVMLDSDYEAMKYENGRGEMEDGTRNNPSSILDLQSSMIREIIIPEIEREVNEGRHFAPLRQIYHSLILAKWYKETVKNSLLSQVYVDQNKIAGVESGDETMKDQIYTQYMEAYKKGVYNYIREDYDRLNNEVVPRKYFSGGEKLTNIPLKKTKGAITGKGLVGNGFMLVAALTLAATLSNTGPVFAQTPGPAVSLEQGSLEKAKDDEGVIREQLSEILYALKWWENSSSISYSDKRILLEAKERNLVAGLGASDIEYKMEQNNQELRKRYEEALKNQKSAVTKEVDKIMKWVQRAPERFENVEVNVLSRGEVIGTTDRGIAREFGPTYGFTYGEIIPPATSRQRQEDKPGSSSPILSYKGENIAVEQAWLSLIQRAGDYSKTEAYDRERNDAVRFTEATVIPEVYLVGQEDDQVIYGAIYSPEEERIYIQRSFIKSINDRNNPANMITRLFIFLLKDGDELAKRKAEYEYAKRYFKGITDSLLPQDRAQGQTFDDVLRNIDQNILGINLDVEQFRAEMGLNKNIQFVNHDDIVFLSHSRKLSQIGQLALFTIAVNALNQEIDLQRTFRISVNDPATSPEVKAGMLAFAANPLTGAHYLIASLKAMAVSGVDTYFVSPTKGDFRKPALEATYKKRFDMASDFLEQATGGLIRVMPALPNEKGDGKGVNGEEKVLPLINDFNKDAKSLTLLYGAGADHFFSFAREKGSTQIKFEEINTDPDTGNKKDFEYYVGLQAYPDILQKLLEHEESAIPPKHLAFIEELAQTMDATKRLTLIKDKVMFPVLDTVGKLFLLQKETDNVTLKMLNTSRDEQPEDFLRDRLGVEVVFNEGANFEIAAKILRNGITKLIQDNVFDFNLFEAMPQDFLKKLLKPENREFLYSLVRVQGLKFEEAVEFSNSIDVLFPVDQKTEDERHQQALENLKMELVGLDGAYEVSERRDADNNVSIITVTDGDRKTVLEYTYAIRNGISKGAGGENTVITKSIETPGSLITPKKNQQIIAAVEGYSKEYNSAKTLTERFPVLVHKDLSKDELKKDDIDVLMLLGNDDLRVIEEVLDLKAGGVGRYILISGGTGRLTEPLKQMAQEHGFEIQPGSGSEAEIIRDIMVSLAQGNPKWLHLMPDLQNPEKTLLEKEARFTVENFSLAKKLLVEKGILAEGQTTTILYAQKPLQQLRAKGAFESVFNAEIAVGQVEGVSFTVDPHQDLSTAVDIIGEYFRIVVNAQKKDPETGIADWQPVDGWKIIPSTDWKDASALFKTLSSDKKIDLRDQMTANVYRMGLNREILYAGLPKHIADFTKLVFESPLNNRSSSPIKSDQEVGGIDLNAIDVDRQGAGVDIQFDPVEIQQIIDLGIDGFAPVIINLTPLPSVLPLLGLEPRKEEELELSSLN